MPSFFALQTCTAPHEGRSGAPLGQLGGLLVVHEPIIHVCSRFPSSRQIRVFFLHGSCYDRGSTLVVPLWCRYVPVETSGTIKATGTTPHTATLVNLMQYVPSDFTGTIACNRHYSTGAIEGPLLWHFPAKPNPTDGAP